MGSQVIQSFGSATVSVAALAKVGAFSLGQYDVNQIVGFPNEPPALQNLFTGTGASLSAAFTLAGQAVINAGAYPVQVSVGVAANVFERIPVFQATPGVLNITGALTTALIETGIVTSTTGAAVAATLDTGTVSDASLTMAVGDSFDWSVVNTGGNAFTVTAAAGHTIVGVAAVATVTSGRFRTTKTAANTFITYRLS